MGRIEFDDLQGARNYSGQRAYSQSKLANIMFTFELARRLEGTGVTATAVHPGVVRTNFGAEDQAWFFAVISGVVRPFLKTPAQGAQTSIYLASSPDLDGVTGQFFANGKPKSPNKVADDADMAARLWRVSAELVGMTPANPANPVDRSSC
jgi:NAD(P)-dependent dehydrogenase (short-subunit alcohol dehydrogenase family)